MGVAHTLQIHAGGLGLVKLQLMARPFANYQCHTFTLLELAG